VRYKILLIDNNCAFVKSTKIFLESKGYLVNTACNGQEGFQKVKEEFPDLILLDMMMTYKTEGLRIVKAITADAAIKDIPIIKIIEERKKFSNETKFNQINLQDKNVIEKPINYKQLLNNISACLQKRSSQHYKDTEMVENLIKKWEGKEGNLIMILHEVQNYYGYIPRGIAFDLTRCLNIPLARIYEVISFYNYFKLEPPGKHIISICMGTACYLKGAPQLFKKIKDILTIEDGEITQDGIFQLQSVRCLGCCGLAPVIMIDGKIYGNLKADDLVEIIAEYTNKEEKTSCR